MCKDKGYIKLYRSVYDNPLFSNDGPYNRLMAWIDLIASANYKTNKIFVDGVPVEVERGTFITSQQKLMMKWKWSKGKVIRFLECLENDNMIVKKTDHKKTAITIVNYGLYQVLRTSDDTSNDTSDDTSNEPVTDHKRTSDGPVTDTNNKSNKDNKSNKSNNKKNNSGRFTPPTLEEVTKYCTERNNSVDPQRFIDFYETKGWMVGKNKMKNWQAAVRTWESNRKKKGADDNDTRGSAERDRNEIPEYQRLNNELFERISRGEDISDLIDGDDDLSGL